MPNTYTFDLGEEIEVYMMDRIEAMIVTADGFIYENGINHQYCMLELCATYWSDRNIDLSESNEEVDYEKELAKAIEMTDTMFRENRLYGFDVYSDGENDYLASHYPQNLDKCYEQMKEYADDHDMILATFDTRDKLGHKCFEVKIKQ